MSSGRAGRQHGKAAVIALALALIATAACSGEAAEVSTTDAGSDEVTLTYGAAEDLSSGDASELREILQARLEALGIDDASVEVDAAGAVITLTPPPRFDASAAGAVLGTTAELRFRPVLQAWPAAEAPDDPAVTPPEDDRPEVVVWLDDEDAEAPMRYQLGPTTVTGSIIESASPQLDQYQQWSVAMVFTPEGIEQFNELTAECSPPSETCPVGQLAIALDSVVHSAPTVQQASFERDQISISGDFSEEEATALALVLRYGALPASLTLESISP